MIYLSCMSDTQNKDKVIAASMAYAQIQAAFELLYEAQKNLSSFPDKPHMVSIVRVALTRAKEETAKTLEHCGKFINKLPV